MARRYYAVQHGDDYACDWGSTNKREALRMAHDMVKDHDYDGEEIRIVLCTTDDDFCDGVIVVRDGTR